MLRLFTCAAVTLLAVPAIAHPGHGVAGDPVIHAVASPMHAWPIVVAAVLLIGGGLVFRRRGDAGVAR